MKKFLSIVVMMLVAVTGFSQDVPKNIVRYDSKDVAKYDGVTYSVVVKTDFATNEKSYYLGMKYDNGTRKFNFLYSDRVVAAITNTFRYLTTTTFEPTIKGETTSMICYVSSDMYFSFKPDGKRMDLYYRPDIYSSPEHLAEIARDEIEEYNGILTKIEKTFNEKGKDLKTVQPGDATEVGVPDYSE